MSQFKNKLGTVFLFSEGKEKERASLVAQLVKWLPATRETWVQSLGREDPLEKEMATYSNIFCLEISWTEDPSRLTVHGVA